MGDYVFDGVKEGAVTIPLRGIDSSNLYSPDAHVHQAFCRAVLLTSVSFRAHTPGQVFAPAPRSGQAFAGASSPPEFRFGLWSLFGPGCHFGWQTTKVWATKGPSTRSEVTGDVTCGHRQRTAGH